MGIKPSQTEEDTGSLPRHLPLISLDPDTSSTPEISIARSLGQIFLLFGQYVKGIASGTRVFELIKQQPTIPLKGGQVIEDSLLAGEIRLRNVTFSYPNRPGQKVLDNLTISIPPGKVVALCGSSGCGKSTIAALIER